MLAAVATASLTLAACSGGSSGGGATKSSSGGSAGQNAGLNKVANPSDHKGGIMRVAQSGDWDSLDPANTYYAFSWNFARLYTRALVTFSPDPGPPKLVPDLATSLTRLGLVDEYQLSTVPIAIGAGRSPFAKLDEHLKLVVVEEQRFRSGALAQILVPRR